MKKGILLGAVALAVTLGVARSVMADIQPPVVVGPFCVQVINGVSYVVPCNNGSTGPGKH